MIKSKITLRLFLIICIGIFFIGCGNDKNFITKSTQKNIVDSTDEATTSFEKIMMDNTNSFDFQKKTVMLNSGYEIPIIGLGTWTQNDTTVENSVYHALKDGYRLIDTAIYYGNALGIKKAVLRAIEEGIVTREEVFITTKIVPFGFSDYEATIKECNEALGLGYIDLMLIHQQGPDEIELYRAIEKAIDDKIVHSLGISNYYTPEDFERVTKEAKILPSVIQNENHPFY